jgi:hypothetical protein
MTIPIFTGQISKGKLVLDNPSKYLVLLSSLEGKRIELVLRKKKSQRSLRVNAYYWGVIVEILSNHLGYDKDETHFNLKAKFAGIKDEEQPGFLRIQSTASMDAARFTRYCEDIKRWAAEFLGVYVPDANECELNWSDYEAMQR